MEFEAYVRKPFKVMAVEITADTIEELAPLIGALAKKPDGTPYIMVDRRLVPNVLEVQLGYWLTKMGNNLRCYGAHAFKNQFMSTTPGIDESMAAFRGEKVTPEQAFPSEGTLQDVTESSLQYLECR